MILCDFEIENAINEALIEIDPFRPSNINPASIDLTLGNSFSMFGATSQPIDPFNESTYPMEACWTSKCIVIEPHMFMLGTTKERINIGCNFIARLEGKSSLARLGLFIHITGGFIDPGFEGRITLEMFNASQMPIMLQEGMRIAQMSIMTIEPPSRPYGSKSTDKYQGQEGVTISRYYLNEAL